MTRNVYANSGISVDNRSPGTKHLPENIYANDLPRTQVTRNDERNKTSGLSTAGVRCYRLTALCLLLLFVIQLTAITVLWVNLVTERNLNKQLKQERDELHDLNKQLKQERDELHDLNKQLKQERDTFDMQDKLKWKRFGSSLYYFSEMKNWTESRQDCIERGADLVIINSTEKQEFIVKQLQGSRKWIGLSDIEHEGKFKWVDGTQLNSSTGHWGYAQPDNKGDEDCVEIGLPERDTWNDRPCFEKQGWICEKRG